MTSSLAFRYAFAKDLKSSCPEPSNAVFGSRIGPEVWMIAPPPPTPTAGMAWKYPNGAQVSMQKKILDLKLNILGEVRFFLF